MTEAVRTPRTRVLPWLLPLLLAAIGCILILARTAIGPGTTGDSVSYVMGAESLRSGEGYSRLSGAGENLPITGFPPGYSVVLAAATQIGGDPYQAGRLLNALLFAANIFLAGVIVFRGTRSWLAGSLASAFLLLSDDMIHIHSWIMSEGLFIFLILVGLLLLEVCLRSGGWLPAACLGLLAAAATLTRYVGLSVGAAEGLALLLLGTTPRRKRWIQAVVFSLALLLPVVAWFGRNGALAGTTVNRGLGYHPLESELVTAFLGTANAWFFPLALGLSRMARAAMSVAIAAGIGIAFLVTAALDRRAGTNSDVRQRTILPWVMVFFLPAYGAILLANSMFLDASTSPSGAARYLMPAYVGMVLLLVSAGHYLCVRWRQPLVRVTVVGLAILVLVLHAIQAWMFTTATPPNLGYTDLRHDMSSTIAELQAMGEGRLFIANNVELIYVLTGRPAYALPIVFDHYRQVYREDFAQQVELNRTRLADGALLLIYGTPDEFEKVALDELGVVAIREFPRITVYADPQARIP
jgi:hypothetical protein